jgi:hypothetical protein
MAEVMSVVYDYPLVQLFCFSTYVFAAFVYFIALGFYSSSIRMLNREINMFNKYCKNWVDAMKTSCEKDGEFTTMCEYHGNLCKCVEVTDNMLTSFVASSLVFMIPQSVLIVYGVLRSQDKLFTAITCAPALLMGFYILFRCIYEPVKLYDKVGSYSIFHNFTCKCFRYAKFNKSSTRIHPFGIVVI